LSFFEEIWSIKASASCGAASFDGFPLTYITTVISCHTSHIVVFGKTGEVYLKG
jgi:hypothetical protein